MRPWLLLRRRLGDISGITPIPGCHASDRDPQTRQPMGVYAEVE